MNPDELDALAQFANCEITLAELLERVRRIEIDFGPAVRRLNFHYTVPEPGIRIELSHIEKAKEELTDVFLPLQSRIRHTKALPFRIPL